MNATQARDLLDKLQRELGCESFRGLALRCDCANLETVYVLVRDGRVVVTDEGESFRYLTESGDDTYVEVAIDDVRQLCARHGVMLNDDDPDGYPEIQRELAEGELVRRAVDLVSGTLDALFDASLRPNLRDPE